MRKLFYLSAVLCLISITTGRADFGISPSGENYSNMIYTTAGFDYSVVTFGLGYAKSIRLTRASRDLTLMGDLALPLMQPDFNDYRVCIGATIPTLVYTTLKIPVFANVIIRGTKNIALRAFGIGTLLGITPGLYRNRFYLAGEIMWDQQWSTFLVHSDYYRKYAYPDVMDGWYRLSSWNIRYGLRIGGILFSNWEIGLRGGYEQHGKYFHDIPNLYAILLSSIRFGKCSNYWRDYKQAQTNNTTNMSFVPFHFTNNICGRTRWLQ